MTDLKQILAEKVMAQMGHALVLTQDFNDAKDLLQDLAVKVFTTTSFYEDKENDEIGKLLSFNLRNVFKDRLRKIKREPEIISEGQSEKLGKCIDVESKLTLDKVHYYLGKAKNKDFGVAVNMYLDGYTQKEIAKGINKKPNAAGQCLINARKYLIKKIA